MAVVDIEGLAGCEDGPRIVTRARARVATGYTFPTELQVVRHATTQLKKHVNRITWSQKRHHEAILVSAVLRAAERATSCVAGHRAKVRQGLWMVRVSTPAGDIDAIAIERPMRKHLVDFDRHVQVTVLRPELVNVMRLELWWRRMQMGLKRPRRR